MRLCPWALLTALALAPLGDGVRLRSPLVPRQCCAVRCNDGSALSWEIQGAVDRVDVSTVNQYLGDSVESIVMTDMSFVALRSESPYVVAWGTAASKSADATAVADAHLKRASGGHDFFTAVTDSDTLQVWGDLGSAGPTPDVTQTTDVLANDYAYIAIHNLTIALPPFTTPGLGAWGLSEYGGGGLYTVERDGNIAAATRGAFAMLSDSLLGAELTSWGKTDSGGDSSAVGAVETYFGFGLHSTESAFAAPVMNAGRLKAIAWGEAATGGDVTTVAALFAAFPLNGNDYRMAATQRAFALRGPNNKIVAWGDAAYGGDSTTVDTLLASNTIDVLLRNYRAFIALDSNVQVVAAWGDKGKGGDTTTVNSLLAGRTLLQYSITEGAFALVFTDGAVVAWGDPAYGGDASAVMSHTLNASSVRSNGDGFSAVTTDGEVVSWGSPGMNAASVSSCRKPLATPAPDTVAPTAAPTAAPTVAPDTAVPTAAPTTTAPTIAPTAAPTAVPPTVAPDTAMPVGDTAVPTQAPTQVPDTPVPPVPVTGVPQTVVPDTAAPETPHPTTPPTGAPATTAPSTPLPRTPSPSLAPTPQPSEPILVDEGEEREEVVEAGGAAAAAGALLGGSAAAALSAMQAVVAGEPCFTDERQNRTLSRVLHPTQWELGGNSALGMVTANIMISVSVALLCTLAVYALKYTLVCFGCHFNWMNDIPGTLHFPAVPLFVWHFLYQSIALGCFLLLFNTRFDHTTDAMTGERSTAAVLVVGVCGTLLSFAAPFLLYIFVRRVVPDTVFFCHDELTQWYQSKALHLLLGGGEWISSETHVDHVARCGGVLKSFTEERAWWMAVELTASFCLAAASAFNADTHTTCGHRKMASAVIFLALLCSEAAFSPHYRMRDLGLMCLAYFAQMLAMVLMATGYYLGYDEGHDVFGASGVFLYVAIAAVVVRSIGDALSELYNLCYQRRERLQGMVLLDKSEMCSVNDTQESSNHDLPKPDLLRVSFSPENTDASDGRDVYDDYGRSLLGGESSVISKQRRNPFSMPAAVSEQLRRDPSGSLATFAPLRTMSSTDPLLPRCEGSISLLQPSLGGQSDATSNYHCPLLPVSTKKVDSAPSTKESGTPGEEVLGDDDTPDDLPLRMTNFPPPAPIKVILL